jgi:cadmium resistance protein CadD (predicted permease)
MTFSLATMGTAIAVFVATNIDDIVLLAVFFGDTRLRRNAIVIGQYLGIGALIAVSVAAAYAVLAVPPGWPALLGVIPLALGLKQLWSLGRNQSDDDDDPSAAERQVEGRMHSQILAISAITVANGADNLSVYIPLFAQDVTAVPVYAITFLLLTAPLCAAGYLLVKNTAGGALMQRFGHIILPVVLIALGMQILWGARVLF